jgi:hypothetical protein
MKAKLILVTIAVLAILASTATAQVKGQRANTRRGIAKVSRLRQPNVLNLTAEQRKNIASIRKNMRIEIADIIKNTQPGKQRKTQVKNAIKSATDSVLGVLTPKQIKKISRIQITKRLLMVSKKKPGLRRVKGIDSNNKMDKKQEFPEDTF